MSLGYAPRAGLPAAHPAGRSGPRRRVGWLPVLVVALAGAVGGCASPAPPHASWVGPPPGRSTSGDSADDGSSGGPAPTASSQVSAYIARLPHFPAAPVPQPVAVPAGPFAGWYQRLPTTQRVAFLTIDDGWVKRPEAPELFAAAHVPVTLFLTINAIRDNPRYFHAFQADGADIEAHTITHTSLVGKPATFQRHEACGSADQLGQWYGRRPVLFRPPFGDKDATTLKVVHDCGMKAAFFWTETVDKGVVRYQRGSTVQPGDILLMHFRPGFDDDFLAALTAIHNAGLTPALLDAYLT